MKDIYYDTIVKISAKIECTNDMDQLLPFIGSILHGIVGFDESSIVLYEDKTLVSKYHKGSSSKIDFTSEDWFSAVAIDHKYDCSVMVNDSGQELVSFILRASNDRVLGFLTGIFPLNIKINMETKAFLSHCSFLLGMAIERNNLYIEKDMNENLKIIGLLKSSVVHDISNLLGISEIYLELAEEESVNNSLLKDYLGAIRSELKRVNVISRDLLDFSKQNLNLHKKEFLVDDLVDELKKYSSVLMNELGIHLKFEVPVGLKMVADRDRLFRVFFNLINNAADALDKGGFINFRIKSVGSNIAFLVADNGKGICKDYLSKLFDPFFTSGKSKGTGLGLTVVREIVESHGGKVLVRSVEGKYTCFYVRIPK